MLGGVADPRADAGAGVDGVEAQHPIEPSSGRWRPSSSPIRVVLPEPLAPSRPVTPCSTLRVAPSSAVVAPKRLTTPSVSMTAATTLDATERPALRCHAGMRHPLPHPRVPYTGSDVVDGPSLDDVASQVHGLSFWWLDIGDPPAEAGALAAVVNNPQEAAWLTDFGHLPRFQSTDQSLRVRVPRLRHWARPGGPRPAGRRPPRHVPSRRPAAFTAIHERSEREQEPAPGHGSAAWGSRTCWRRSGPNWPTCARRCTT